MVQMNGGELSTANSQILHNSELEQNKQNIQLIIYTKHIKYMHGGGMNPCNTWEITIQYNLTEFTNLNKWTD
jgi:hypothetical protein